MNWFGSLTFCLLGTTLSAQSVLISDNTGQPDVSARLEIRASDKGLLIPQVSLSGSQDAQTIANPAQGLVVFNDGQHWLPAGFFLNLGSPQNPNWHQLFVNPAVDSLVMAQQRITGLPAPLQPGDAVNKAYVDNLVTGSGGTGGSQISYPVPTTFSSVSNSGLRYLGALVYCRNLTEGGHTDWRLPSVHEFEYMVQESSVVLPNLVNGQYYWFMTESQYSSSSNGSAQFKYTLYFNNQFSDSYFSQYTTSSTTPFAICVR